MLKRLGLLGLLIGAGQIITLLSLKSISKTVSIEKVNVIGELDSLLLLIISIIGSGLQAVAIRNIATSNEWKKEYASVQTARITLSLILSLLGIAGFINQEYLIFFISLLLALSGEYALYGLGQPIFAGIIVLIRAVLPYGLMIISANYYAEYTVHSFIAGYILAFVITNILISGYLQVPLFFQPRLDSLLLYLKSLYIGVSNLSMYFLGLGMLMLIPYFFQENTLMAVSFIGLKFYMLFKAVIRVIHQAFTKEMQKEEMCTRVDRLSMIGGGLFLSSILFFPETFINSIFGAIFLEEVNFFILLAASALIYSFFSSLTTFVVLKKFDKQFAVFSAIGAIVAIGVMILLSNIINKAWVIPVSLSIGELAFIIGLYKVVGNRNGLIERLYFLIEILVAFAIPFIIVLLLGDTLFSLVIGEIGFLLLLLIFNKKHFGNLQFS